MQQYLCIVAFFLMGCTCCNKSYTEKRDKSGVVTSKQAIWVSSLGDNIGDEGMIESLVLKVGNRVTAHTELPNKATAYSGFSLGTGNRLWEWQEQDLPPYLGFDENGYVWGDKYVVARAAYHIVVLDASKGKWVQYFFTKNGNDILGVSGYEDKIIYEVPRAGSEDTLRQDFLVHNLLSGELLDSIPVNYYTDYTGSRHLGSRYEAGMIECWGNPFKDNRTGDWLLPFVFYDFRDTVNIYGGDTWTYARQLSLYDLDRKSYVYTVRLPISFFETGGYLDKMKVVANKVIINVGSIYVYDWETGSFIWKKRDLDLRDLGGSGNSTVYATAVSNNAIVCSSENVTYGLDLNTGNLLWKHELSGGTTKMDELNGVVYFVGKGDGVLYAIEAATGNFLWKMEGKEKDHYNDGGILAITAENGEPAKIIATSDKHIWCYEAVR